MERKLRSLETGVVVEVSASHADYLLHGGANARDDFAPEWELVDESTECGPPLEVREAATPLGEGEASPPQDPTPLDPEPDDRSRREPSTEQAEGDGGSESEADEAMLQRIDEAERTGEISPEQAAELRQRHAAPPEA